MLFSFFVNRVVTSEYQHFSLWILFRGAKKDARHDKANGNQNKKGNDNPKTGFSDTGLLKNIAAFGVMFFLDKLGILIFFLFFHGFSTWPISSYKGFISPRNIHNFGLLLGLQFVKFKL